MYNMYVCTLYLR